MPPLHRRHRLPARRLRVPAVRGRASVPTEPGSLPQIYATFIDTVTWGRGRRGRQRWCRCPHRRADHRATTSGRRSPTTGAATLELATPGPQSRSYCPDWLRRRHWRAARPVTAVVAPSLPTRRSHPPASRQLMGRGASRAATRSTPTGEAPFLPSTVGSLGPSGLPEAADRRLPGPPQHAGGRDGDAADHRCSEQNQVRPGHRQRARRRVKDA
jgi:hypothetical protein